MTTTEPVESPRQSRWMAAARVATGVVLFALVVLATARNWSEVRDTVGRMSPLGARARRAARARGSRRQRPDVAVVARSSSARACRLSHAAKIYLIGQLGKYVPGSFWAFLVQMELAHRVSVPRSRALAASIVAAGVAVLSGLAVGLLVIPSVVGEPRAALQRGRRPRRRLRRGAQSARARRGWWTSSCASCGAPRSRGPSRWPGMLAATGWALLSLARLRPQRLGAGGGGGRAGRGVVPPVPRRRCSGHDRGLPRVRRPVRDRHP